MKSLQLAWAISLIIITIVVGEYTLNRLNSNNEIKPAILNGLVKVMQEQSEQIALNELVSDAASLSSVTQGSGKNKIYAVIDVNCEYCKRLYSEMQVLYELNQNPNVEVSWIVVSNIDKHKKAMLSGILSGETNNQMLSSLNRLFSDDAYIPSNKHWLERGKVTVEGYDDFISKYEINGYPTIITNIEGHIMRHDGYMPNALAKIYGAFANDTQI